MNILDDLNKIREIDKEGMLKIEEDFYGQLIDAKKIAENINLIKIKARTYSGIAFLGMGGSGFAGSLIRDLVKDDIGVPVEVVKGYNIPGCIDSDWLVVAVSYSGNTEETISTTTKSLDRGSEILCVTSGGKLEEIANNYNKCLIKIPSGLQPRGAIGYLFFPTFLVLSYLKLIDISDDDVKESLDLICQKCSIYKREVNSDKNYAKSIALKIADSLPIVYGTEGILSSVAYRWKCEVNGNSKAPCFWNEFPELNHNETVGWERLRSITSRFSLIVFKEKEGQIRIKTRIETTIKLIKDNLFQVLEIPVEGKSKLSKALSTMYLGDIASVYLAILNEINPTPVDKIKALKAELAKLD
jgi:glucose/mannose-6-phosphate isomerase